MTIGYFANLWEVSYFWLWVVALHNFHVVSENYVLQFNPQTMKAINKKNELLCSQELERTNTIDIKMLIASNISLKIRYIFWYTGYNNKNSEKLIFFSDRVCF